MHATELAVDKSSWGEGPWQTEPDRVDFVHAGLACLALRHPDHGFWCGYVGVPREHPDYGKQPEEGVDADVHGGLNYGDVCSGPICHVPQPGMPADVWWLGFDCGHLCDLAPGRIARLRILSVSFPGLPDLPAMPREVYRDLPYVRREIKRLADQLARRADG